MHKTTHIHGYLHINSQILKDVNKIHKFVRCVYSILSLSYTHTHTHQTPEDAWLSHRPPWSCNQWPQGVPALQVFFSPLLKRQLLLPLPSVVVHTFTVKHLHFQSALHSLLNAPNVQQCTTLFQSRRLIHVKQPSVSCGLLRPSCMRGKPEHTCIQPCINTVIHTGVYMRWTVFYGSGNGIVLMGNGR